MNERLKELKQQAGIDFNPDQEGLDLFAELIVRECASVATMNQYQSYTTGHYVLKHFGVEE